MAEISASVAALYRDSEIPDPNDDSEKALYNREPSGGPMQHAMNNMREILADWSRVCTALRSKAIEDPDLLWLENAVGTFTSRCWIERRQKALDAGFRPSSLRMAWNRFRDTLASIATDCSLPPSRATLRNRIRLEGFQGALTKRSSGEQLALLSVLMDTQALLELEEWATSPEAAGSAWPAVLDRSGAGIIPLCLDLRHATEITLQNAWRTGDESYPRIEPRPLTDPDKLLIAAWFPEEMIGRQVEAVLSGSNSKLIRSLEEQAIRTDVHLSRLLVENWKAVRESSEAKTSQPQGVEGHELQFELVGHCPRPLIDRLLFVGVT